MSHVSCVMCFVVSLFLLFVSTTRLTVSSPVVVPSASLTITMSGTLFGFLLYVRDPTTGVHVGRLAPNADSAPCTSGGHAASSTMGHNNAGPKTILTWTWTAPPQEGLYTITAIVTEQTGQCEMRH